MNRPGIVRAVALLLVLVGLQAGSFSGLDSGDERYYGTEDYSAVVRPEARKPDVIPVPLPAAQPPRVAPATEFAAFAALAQAETGNALPQRLRPTPTGPPRA